MTAEQLVAERKRCKEDPIYLAQKLGYDIQEDPHRGIFEALWTGKKKRMVLWPRGHFKTSCVVVELVRRILNDPDIRILVMQATLKLTKGWLSEIKSHFDGRNTKSELPLLFPEFCGHGLGDAHTFTVPARTRKHLKEATVTAASPKAITTGQHYDLMAFDDLVNANNFRNIELLDKLESEFYHFLPLLNPGGDVLVTGTRYSYADLYARFIAKDAGVNDWTISVKECYSSPGKLLFEERTLPDGRKIGFTLELLAKLRVDDPEMFAPQYLNKIMASGDQLFSAALLSKVTKSSRDPEFPNNGFIFMAVDLAEGKRADADHSVIAVGTVDNRGRVWVIDVVGGQMTSYTLVTMIIRMALQYHPTKILIEKQPGAEHFLELLFTIARERGVKLPAEFTPNARKKNAKYLRISLVSDAMKLGKLFLSAGIIDYAQVAEECEQYPRGRHDDRPDCIGLLYLSLSQLVPYRPALRQLPWVFNVPHSTEQKPRSDSPLGNILTC